MWDSSSYARVVRHAGTSADSPEVSPERLAAGEADLARELMVVGEIQRSLLPAVLPDIPGFDIESYYHPCAKAGGDYFDVVPLVGGQWGLILADVAGHGVSAAVIMAVMRALVHTNLPHTRFMPSRVFLDFMNKQMTDVYTTNGRFVTVWCAVLNPVTRLLTYASAGHPPARLIRNGSVTALNAVAGLPIGVDRSSTYEEMGVILEPDDLLVAYTDGITEAVRCGVGRRTQFGTERLDQVLIEADRLPAFGCVERVVAAVDAFTGACEPADDQTMLAMRVL